MGPAALDALQRGANSDDPEAAQMARDLIKKASGSAKTGDIRRLMAIRTLGERKEKSATALLKSLADSKDLFVADYANRALDQIDGKPLKVIDHHADLVADLAMLPSTTGTIFQTTGLGQRGVNLDTFFDLTLNIKAAGAPVNPAEKQAATRISASRLTDWPSSFHTPDRAFLRDRQDPFAKTRYPRFV